MADVVRMPKMSDTMTEGVIVEWHKKVGDKVKPGDVLAEIETDKAVMEFESFQNGTLLYIGVEKGQSVKVDEVIAVMGKEGEDFKELLKGEGNKEVQPTPEIKEKQPEPTEEQPPENQDAKKREKEEKTPDPPETRAEKITEADKEQRDTLKNEVKSKGQEADPPIADKTSQKVKASPLAKKMASDSKISLEKIKGSGDEGRIIRRDIEKLLTEKTVTRRSQSSLIAPEEESFDEIAVSMMRKTIAKRLAESKFSAPHFYLTMEINMDRCADMRTQITGHFPDEKISFNDIIIKSAALALRKNLKVNSSWMGDKIRYNHHIHIGMAVAVEDGLLVPVIKFADQKSFSQINAESKLLAARAREKKLQPDEMQGNTFTISNLGMMDIDEFTAIINPPDSCILAIGNIKKQPVIINDELEIARIMKVTMSCDHRAVDGATGALFLQTLKGYLENPITMLY
ncbi:MAG: dihydrolipoamide acetyltransferase family protein [Chitinophagales bacterium]